jgi:hypothetical protein
MVKTSVDKLRELLIRYPKLEWAWHAIGFCLIFTLDHWLFQ